MNNLIKAMTGVALSVALVIGLATATSAQDLSSGEPGDVIVLLDLDDIAVASTCVVTFDNNESSHPGNVAIARSSLERQIEADFEDGSGEQVVLSIESDGVLFAGVRLGETGGTSTLVEYFCEQEQCPIADALDAGWVPGGDIPCGHSVVTTTTTTPQAPTTTTTPQETTTTTVEPPTTTTLPDATTAPPPPQTCPENALACTGASSSDLGWLGALMVLLGLSFTVVKRFAQ